MQQYPWRIDLTKVTNIPPKNPHISGREEHQQSGKVTYEVEMEIREDAWGFFDVSLCLLPSQSPG